MGVKIHQLDETGNPDAEPGSRPWAIYFVNQTKMVRKQLNTDVERLQGLIRKLQLNKAWEAMGYPSFSMLAAKEIGLEPEQVQEVVSAAKGTKLKDIPTLHKHGREEPEAHDPKTGRFTKDSKNENGILGPRGGNNQPYRIAKLKRDYPAIAERLQSGEFKNVREAERAAGLNVPPKLSRVRKLIRAYDRLTESEQSEFREAIC